jgi:translocation and assembly module TamB
MSRRRVVLMVSLGLVLVLVILAGAGAYVLTRTGWGQDKVRTLIQQQLASALRGPVYLGRITGSYLNELTIDSLEIRDTEDSLFVASGPVTLRYDVRDIIDRRLLFNRVVMEHPTIYLREFESGHWNYDSVFRAGGAPRARTPGPKFGDYVVLDSVTLRRATFLLTKPWHPDDSLHGARRDSAIASALHDPDMEVRRRRDGYARTWRWTGISAEVGHARISDPDSVGHTFVVTRLAAVEQDPPFVFHDVAGQVRVLGDSVWVTLPHFALPGSHGSASGKVVWGSDLPVRWDLHIVADSVSLADVAWVYPTLPTTGGGSVVLDIQNEKNLDVIDYRLTRMDVRTTGSHLLGAMTFAVGGPVLQVRDVNLRGNPVDFDLLRTFNGGPFPVDWRGRVTGTVVARGGPLTQFVVDSSHLIFHDAHVPGAVSELSGRGALDILQPAFTAFHDFAVDARTLDLRTVEYLYPDFPGLVGTVSGRAILDSSWLDVRFRDADMRLHTGDAPVSRVTGQGRITYGEVAMRYDVALATDSLSFSALRHSYPGLPLAGSVAGTITARGTADQLFLDAALQGPGGSFSYNGYVDVDTPFVSVHGSGRLVAVDPSLVMADSMPSGSLTGTFNLQLGGDSLATLAGSASLALERSVLDRVQIFSSVARLRFGDGRMQVDTLSLETTAARFRVDSGALGLRPGVVDSLYFQVHVDSLGGLRPFLATQNAIQTGIPDSLAGSFDLDAGLATGNLVNLSVQGVARGRELYLNHDRGASATLKFNFDDVLRAPRGVASLALDTLVVAGVHIDSIGVSANLVRTAAQPGDGLQFRGTYAVGALSDNGSTLRMGGSVSHARERTTVGIDSATVDLLADRWQLTRVGMVEVGPQRVDIDTLVLQNARGGRVLVAGTLPAHSTVALRFLADSIPVHDVATLLQMPDSMSGWGALHVDVAGTREAPRATLDATAHNVNYGGVTLSSVVARASYADHRTEATLRLDRNGHRTLEATASLPMELALFNGRLLDEPLRGSIRADSADFALVEVLVPTLTRAKGRWFANLTVGGTWAHPTLDGELKMDNAEVSIDDIGVTLKGLDIDLVASAPQDRITIRSLTAYNAATSPSDNVVVGGFVDLSDRDNPQFDLFLKAHEFRAVDKRTLARLDISTAPRDSIALTGHKNGSVLSGTINIVRGAIYIPERDLANKQLVQLTSEDLVGLDTTELNPNIKLPSPPSALLRDMTVRAMTINLGDDVWLRSSEANIKLTGALNVRLTQVAATPTGFNGNGGARRADLPTTPRLALDGTLTAERGTYTLSLGPIQREFQVQSGTITYYGTTDLNPNVNITAQYTVRQANRPDVNVIATLSGFLYPGPTLDLQSGETFAIAQSDLVSYLCCGVPSFELGANQSSLQTAAQVLLPTAGSVLARTLHRQLGSTFDVLQFQPGATDQTARPGQAGSNATRDFFSGARLGGSRQITNNVFFSINTGLCQLSSGQSGSGDTGASGFFNQLEAKLQYRFSPWMSAEVGLEPPSSALLCGRTQRGLVPTPQQWGLSLTRVWRW